MSATEKTSLEQMEKVFPEEAVREPVGEVNKEESGSGKKELSGISIASTATNSAQFSKPSTTVNELMSGLHISETKVIQKGCSPESQGVIKKKASQNKSVSLRHSVVAKPGECEEREKGMRQTQNAETSNGAVKMPKRKHTDTEQTAGLDLSKKTPRKEGDEIERDSVVTKRVRFQKNAPKETQVEKPLKQARAGCYYSPPPHFMHPLSKTCSHRERPRPGGISGHAMDRPGVARPIPQRVPPTWPLYAPPKPVPATTYSYSTGPVLIRRHFPKCADRMKKDDLPICLLEKLNKQYHLLKAMQAQRNQAGKSPCEYMRRMPMAGQVAMVCSRCLRPRPPPSEQWKDVAGCQYAHQTCLCTIRINACQHVGEHAQGPIELTPLQREGGGRFGTDKLAEKKDSENKVAEKVAEKVDEKVDEKKTEPPNAPAMPDIAKLNINENPGAASVSVQMVATDLKQVITQFTIIVTFDNLYKPNPKWQVR